jgi:hypothetical protein
MTPERIRLHDLWEDANLPELPELPHRASAPLDELAPLPSAPAAARQQELPAKPPAPFELQPLAPISTSSIQLAPPNTPPATAPSLSAPPPAAAHKTVRLSPALTSTGAVELEPLPSSPARPPMPEPAKAAPPASSPPLAAPAALPAASPKLRQPAGGSATAIELDPLPSSPSAPTMPQASKTAPADFRLSSVSRKLEPEASTPELSWLPPPDTANLQPPASRQGGSRRGLPASSQKESLQIEGTLRVQQDGTARLRGTARMGSIPAPP